MEQVKKFADQVFTTLGAGFTERIYHNAMEVLLRKNNIPFQSEQNIPVMFEGENVGTVRADLVINKTIVVELKSVRSIKDDHSTQCGMYMKLLNIPYGVVINFPCSDSEDVTYQELINITGCSRCGRENHDASKCYAKRHADGSLLD
jgi:GxxExxY protein